jgi:hypothetical protein
LFSIPGFAIGSAGAGLFAAGATGLVGLGLFGGGAALVVNGREKSAAKSLANFMKVADHKVESQSPKEVDYSTLIRKI